METDFAERQIRETRPQKSNTHHPQILSTIEVNHHSEQFTPAVESNTTTKSHISTTLWFISWRGLTHHECSIFIDNSYSCIISSIIPSLVEKTVCWDSGGLDVSDFSLCFRFSCLLFQARYYNYSRRALIQWIINSDFTRQKYCISYIDI